jgi:TonB family protein
MVRAHTGLSRHGAALWIVCGLAAPISAAVAAPIGAFAPDEAGAPATADLVARDIDFDIPAQALATALDRFSELSGHAALFSSTLAAGRMSSPVLGRYTPKTALQLLLAGSGLDVEEISTGQVATFVLKPAAKPPDADAMPAPDSAAAHAGLDNYDGLIQAKVWASICADRRTASGSYRSLLRFQVDAAGRIERARLLGSSGDRRRDRLLLTLLQNVQVGRPPPPDMAQPVTMLILPGQDGGPVCSGGEH